MSWTPRMSLKTLAIPALAAMVLLAGCTSSSTPGPGGGGGGGTQVSSLGKVIKAGTIKVAVLPDFPPYSVQKPDGSFAGYEVDIARDLAKAMGVKLQLVSANGTSRLPLLKSGRVDVNISSWTATDERAKAVGFTIPYVAHGASVLFAKSNPVKSYADLNGKTVSVARGSTNDTIVTKDFPKAKVKRFQTIADAIAALKAGKVDAAVESFTTVQQEAAKDPSLAALNAPPLDPALVSMGVLPGDQVWLNYLNNYIRNLIASGNDAKIYKKWLHAALPAVVLQVP